MKRFLESAELSEVELGTASSRREERQNAETASGRGGRMTGCKGYQPRTYAQESVGIEKLHILGCPRWRYTVTMNEGSVVRPVCWSDPELSHAG